MMIPTSLLVLAAASINAVSAKYFQLHVSEHTCRQEGESFNLEATTGECYELTDDCNEYAFFECSRTLKNRKAAMFEIVEGNADVVSYSMFGNEDCSEDTLLFATEYNVNVCSNGTSLRGEKYITLLSITENSPVTPNESSSATPNESSSVTHNEGSSTTSSESLWETFSESSSDTPSESLWETFSESSSDTPSESVSDTYTANLPDTPSEGPSDTPTASPSATPSASPSTTAPPSAIPSVSPSTTPSVESSSSDDATTTTSTDSQPSTTISEEETSTTGVSSPLPTSTLGVTDEDPEGRVCPDEEPDCNGASIGNLSVILSICAMLLAIAAQW